MARKEQGTSRTPVDLLTLSDTQMDVLREIAEYGGFVPIPKSALPLGVAKSTLGALMDRGLVGTANYRAHLGSKVPDRLRDVQLYWITERGKKAAAMHA